MPRLYTHKIGGWRIVYRVWFPDCTYADKTRYARKKATAQIILADVGALESLSRKGHLTREEITRALNAGYITEDEALRLGGAKPSLPWCVLKKEYEKWARTSTAGTSYLCNLPKLEKVLAFFEEYPPAAVTEELVKKYIQARKDGLVTTEVKKRGRKNFSPKGSDGTIRKELVILRKLLDLQFGEAENPARRVPLPDPREERIPRPFYPDEMGAFLAEIDQNKDWLDGNLKLMTYIYLYAGLRPSEIVRLAPSDVNMVARKLHVQGRTKSGYARSVDIHAELMPMLKERIEKCKDKVLFSYSANSLGRAIRKVIKKAKLTGLQPYSLRHSFVTYILQASMDLKKTQELAGHRSLDTTTRYVHAVPSVSSPVDNLSFAVAKKDGKKNGSDNGK